jgi:histidyl-tRNA synthetase
MSLSTQPYKGARDFYPEDKRLQKWMFAKWRSVCEQFGYEEYDAPLLEPTDLYLQKGSQEIVDEETYTFTDRGDRSVTIRTEMTPTVSRMVAGRRQELPYPLRWYSIPNLWRYDRPQRGRLREFWQLNVDIFGVAGETADFEIILMADRLMKAFGATADQYTIRVNSRQLVDVVLHEFLELDDVQSITMRRLLDKREKMDPSVFLAAAEAIFLPSQRDAGALDKLQTILAVKTVDNLAERLREHHSGKKLLHLMQLLSGNGVTNAQFDLTLMRGFDYYTDIVFEVFDTDPANNRSMFGGGRYDGLVGLFGVEPVPTVGFGMGDVTLYNFLEAHRLLPVLAPACEVFVILAGDEQLYERAQKPIAKLRNMHVRLAVGEPGKKMDKQIKTALKLGVPYVLFIGEAELAEDRYKLRNLASSEEEQHGLERIAAIVKDRRHIDEQDLLLAD